MSDKLFIKCKICDKCFEKIGNLAKHVRLHNLTTKDYYDKFLKKENEGICLNCGKETEFYRISCGYKKYCCRTCSCIHLTPIRKLTMLNKYGAETTLGKNSIIRDKILNKLKTRDWSDSIQKRENTCLLKFGEKSISNTEFFKRNKYKRYKFNEIYFDSSWEMAFYVYLKDHNIDFEYQPNIKFEYNFNNKIHKYHPDFKVNNEIIEIKGEQFFDNDKMINPFDRAQDDLYEAKHQCMIKNNVIIIKNCEKYINYFIKKYGNIKDFKIEIRSAY
ncbi:MAG: hypothetical protein ACI35S_00320 [Anaeroplasma sp.]